MRHIWWGAILSLLLAAPVFARDIYVNNLAGNDAKDGLAASSVDAETGPVRTIRRALRHAETSDRIVLANTGEPYRESISLVGRHSGVPYAPFEIVGNGAILDGSLPVPADAWEFSRGEIFRFQPPHLSAAQQLFRDGLPLTRGPGPTLEGRLPPLAPLHWRYFDGAIEFRPEKDHLPMSYDLTYAALPVGITLYQVKYVTISDLTVQGFRLDGINAHDSAFAVRLIGITARGNGRSGISIGGSSQVEIEGSLVGNNGAAQVRTEGWSHTKIINSTLLDNTAPPLVKTEHSEVQELTVK
jgi:hypothetical protein